MNDSPIGLAAYLLEKFSSCTNKSFLSLPDGGLTDAFTLDDLLTNVMIYWINENMSVTDEIVQGAHSTTDSTTVEFQTNFH